MAGRNCRLKDTAHRNSLETSMLSFLSFSDRFRCVMDQSTRGFDFRVEEYQSKPDAYVFIATVEIARPQRVCVLCIWGLKIACDDVGIGSIATLFQGAVHQTKTFIRLVIHSFPFVSPSLLRTFSNRFTG